jgi:hypothetical protein
MIMSEPSDEEFLRAAQKRAQPFLDCVAYLLAKSWLRDQRQQEKKPSQKKPKGHTEQLEP